MKLDQSCSSKPPDSYSHSHRSPAHSPPGPRPPLHLRILVRFGGFEILVRTVICGAELLVSLVLLRCAEIGPGMCRVREAIGGSGLRVDHGQLAGRKRLVLL